MAIILALGGLLVCVYLAWLSYLVYRVCTILRPAAAASGDDEGAADAMILVKSPW